MYMALLKVCAQMPRLAGIMLVRRGVTVEDWSDPKQNQYGIKATTRVFILESGIIILVVPNG
jgi:hypothetical protein